MGPDEDGYVYGLGVESLGYEAKVLICCVGC